MEEIKTKIIEEIVGKYISADIMPEDDGDIMSDAEYCKQIVECLIDTKIEHGKRFNLPQTVKYLKMDIVESYAP